MNKIKTGLLSIIAAFSFVSSAMGTTIQEKTPNVDLIYPSSKEFIINKNDVYYGVSSSLMVYNTQTKETKKIKNFATKKIGKVTPKDVRSDLLLFEQLNELFLYDLNTEKVTRITNDNGKKGKASLSDDGKLVAYASKLYGDEDIFLYHIDTGKTETVVNTKEDEINPTFVPGTHDISFQTEEEQKFFATAKTYKDTEISFGEDERGGEYSLIFLREKPETENAIVYMKPIGGEKVKGEIRGKFTPDLEYFILNNGSGIYSIKTEELFE